MYNYEVRNAYDFNRDKELRANVLDCRDMFSGLRLTWLAERDSRFAAFTSNTRI